MLSYSGREAPQAFVSSRRPDDPYLSGKSVNVIRLVLSMNVRAVF